MRYKKKVIFFRKIYISFVYTVTSDWRQEEEWDLLQGTVHVNLSTPLSIHPHKQRIHPSIHQSILPSISQSISKSVSHSFHFHLLAWWRGVEWRPPPHWSELHITPPDTDTCRLRRPPSTPPQESSLPSTSGTTSSSNTSTTWWVMGWVKWGKQRVGRFCGEWWGFYSEEKNRN